MSNILNFILGMIIFIVLYLLLVKIISKLEIFDRPFIKHKSVQIALFLLLILMLFSSIWASTYLEKNLHQATIAYVLRGVAYAIFLSPIKYIKSIK